MVSADGLDDGLDIHIAKAGEFVSDGIGQLVFCPANEDVRLNPKFQELLDAVLGRLGLQFARSGQIRDQVKWMTKVSSGCSQRIWRTASM